MIFNNENAYIYVPGGQPEKEAFKRTTHLGIGAHPDDLEIMAFHGIKACCDTPGLGFGGVTCTNGKGSPRTGKFALYNDQEIVLHRRKEQEKAAKIGKYGFVIQLDYPSDSIKSAGAVHLEEDLVRILSAVHPKVIYTHNPADKHDTHVATMISVINAIREMPTHHRPGKVFGCEVWRGLDWLPDRDKIALDVSDESGLAKKLVGAFESQIEGGKRYDLATFGRRRANATFYQPHAVDDTTQLLFAMDLTPLAHNDNLGIPDYVASLVKRFEEDVDTRLKRFMHR